MKIKVIIIIIIKREEIVIVMYYKDTNTTGVIRVRIFNKSFCA